MPENKTIVPNDKNLSLDAYGLLSTMLNVPERRGELNRDKMKKETEKIHSLPRKKQKQREKSKENMR